jgi:hypothetical protein
LEAGVDSSAVVLNRCAASFCQVRWEALNDFIKLNMQIKNETIVNIAFFRNWVYLSNYLNFIIFLFYNDFIFLYKK